ncbi:hypothetical protein CEUSTIGMA_g2582.t1 [Chlamydomonas eustigma]|uniref:SLC41A/MgtE integral membrane domain-containing protein n=1 Tax=Chlamydomonas eustigma TaxID=1157962 RepID=A0A250WWC3_9CHLO|nr:hypothetical protein CEUSTIGMA_g2582.t1 [Chlamydomonas eustigma]|eukprot:GAX75138.1 hypothetical protein CEUSTIGMA_g2582.t1 [Chlamydomonas eustigma]
MVSSLLTKRKTNSCNFQKYFCTQSKRSRSLLFKVLDAVPNPSASPPTLHKTVGNSARARALAIAAEKPLLTLSVDESWEEDETDYRDVTTATIVKMRTGWLAIFCVGLVLAAGVVRDFDDLIAQHVELSFFVPLIMGHGGNTGSQTTCAVIRALALHQASFKNVAQVVAKEAAAGFIMGAVLGSAIFALSLGTHSISPEIGLVVAISLPVVSVWSNGLGAFLTLASSKLHLDPAMTSAPLMTTIVDTTGLVIYFLIAEAVMSKPEELL